MPHMHKHTCDAHAGRQASTEHEQDWEHHLLLRVRRAIQESGHTPESLFSQWDRDGDNSMTELELLQGLRCNGARYVRYVRGWYAYRVRNGGALGASRPALPVRILCGRLVRVACTYPTEVLGRTCQLLLQGLKVARPLRGDAWLGRGWG